MDLILFVVVLVVTVVGAFGFGALVLNSDRSTEEQELDDDEQITYITEWTESKRIKTDKKRGYSLQEDDGESIDIQLTDEDK